MFLTYVLNYFLSLFLSSSPNSTSSSFVFEPFSSIALPIESCSVEPSTIFYPSNMHLTVDLPFYHQLGLYQLPSNSNTYIMVIRSKQGIFKPKTLLSMSIIPKPLNVVSILGI